MPDAAANPTDASGDALELAPNLTPAELDIYGALLNDDLHARLNEFLPLLSQSIQSRYVLTLSLAGLAEELHRRQAMKDKQIEFDEELAIAGDALAIVADLLAPLTGGGSLAMGAIVLVTMTGVGLQIGGESAAGTTTLLSAKDADDFVQRAQDLLNDDAKTMASLSGQLTALDTAFDAAYAALVASVGAKYPDVALPDKATFRQLVFTLHSLPDADLNTFKALIFGGTKAVAVGSYVAANAAHVFAVVHVIYTSLTRGFSALVTALTAVAAGKRKLSANRVMPSEVEAAELERIAVTAQGEGEVAVRVWRRAMDYEMKNPGLVLRVLDWSAKSLSVEKVLTTSRIAKGLYILNGLLDATALVLDIFALKEVRARIAAQSWSEAAIGVERLRIRLEAQTPELSLLRASFDPASYQSESCFLQHAASGRYLCARPTVNSLGQKGNMLDLVEVNDGHLNNPNLAFNRIPVRPPAPAGATAPAVAPAPLLHRLSDQSALIGNVAWPDLFFLRTTTTTTFTFEQIGATGNSGRLRLTDTRPYIVNSDYMAAMPRPGVEPPTDLELHGYLITPSGNPDALIFNMIDGAASDQMFIPSYGYLRRYSWDDFYVKIDSGGRVSVARGPCTELDAFALAGNGCLQHRFSYNCLRPGTDGIIVLDTKPQADCQWMWGDVMDAPDNSATITMSGDNGTPYDFPSHHPHPTPPGTVRPLIHRSTGRCLGVDDSGTLRLVDGGEGWSFEAVSYVDDAN